MSTRATESKSEGRPIDFRRHIIRRSLPGQASRHPFQGSRHAEIAQLETSVLVEENIVRFDIPVDNVPLSADFQRRADIRSQPDDFVLPKAAFFRRVADKGLQQLHPDQDIPYHFVFRLIDPVILNRDDVRVSPDRGHQLDLRRVILHNSLIILPGLLLPESFGVKRFHLALVPRDFRHLDGGIGRACQVLPDCFVYDAESTCADPVGYFPFRPDFLQDPPNFLSVHLSHLTGFSSARNILPGLSRSASPSLRIREPPRFQPGR